MTKTAVTYGKKRTSSRMLDGRRRRRSLLASFSSTTSDTNQAVINPPLSSIQYDSIATTSNAKMASMHPSSTTGSSTLGRRQRSTAPTLAPITSLKAPLTSTANETGTLFEGTKTDTSLTTLRQSPLLARPVQAARPMRHCSAVKATKTEISRPNTLKTLGSVDIDNKVTAMLAATASLKPQPLPTTPRLCTSASRASSATGSQPREAIRALRKIRSGKLVSENTPEPQKRSIFQAEPSTLAPEQLTMIELRLNEGNNLNRRKVQKIVGGSIKRKPVRSQPEHRSGIDDGPGCQVRLDIRLGTPPGHYHIRPRDPFQDETSFEENLFDGLLRECPTGCSTPKPTAITSPKLHRIRQEEDYCRRPKLVSETLYTKAFYGSTNFESEAPSVESISGDSRVKKHPSPSKKALEDLETAFAMYTKLKPLAGGDDTDELAKDNRGALAVADHNRAMRQSRVKCAATEPAFQVARKGACRIRYGLPYRSALTSSRDIDELRD